MLTRLEIYGVIGAIIAALVLGNYFYVKHLQTKIATLENKVAGLELRAEIVEKAQRATDSYMKTRDQRVKKNVQDDANIDKMVESGDDPAMRQLFIDHGLLTPKTGASGSRSPGNPRHISP